LLLPPCGLLLLPLLIQARGFSLALDGGDLLGMMVSVAQAFILMLQMLGISYLLYALGRMLVVALWNRSGLTHRRGVHGEFADR
jgi:hypothetical protein